MRMSRETVECRAWNGRAFYFVISNFPRKLFTLSFYTILRSSQKLEIDKDRKWYEKNLLFASFKEGMKIVDNNYRQCHGYTKNLL